MQEQTTHPTSLPPVQLVQDLLGKGVAQKQEWILKPQTM